MNLYAVEYKDYQQTKTLHIVAAQPGKAHEGARMHLNTKWMKSAEITNITKLYEITRIQK